MPINVSSPRNPLIKEFKKLSQNRLYRQKVNKIALEGPNLVREALKAGLVPEVIFYTRDYYESSSEEWLSEMPVAVMQVILSNSLFKSIAETETPQAVAAILPFKSEKDYQVFEEPSQFILILDRLQDPGNMGTIIRTAAAAGVDRVFFTLGSVDPYCPKVLRSTAGAIFSLPLEFVSEPGKMVIDLKKKGVQIVAASAHSNLQYWSADLKGPVALIIGNEAGGVSPELKKAADIKVSIPLAGSVDSLNAAVATGVILFEIVRQRNS